MTNKQSKHSPVPYVAVDDRAFIDIFSGANRICSLRKNLNGKANARYIVKACNNYPMLVSTLELALAELNTLMPFGDHTDTHILGTIRGVLSQIDKDGEE